MPRVLGGSKVFFFVMSEIPLSSDNNPFLFERIFAPGGKMDQIPESDP